MASLNPLAYPARFQYQYGAPCGGSSCCTDTCIQMIVEYYKEKKHSLSYIRTLAQSETSFNEGACTGINYVEVLTALRKLGVNHYRLGTGYGAAFVKSKVLVGPVIVGVHYGSYPNRYNGSRSNRAEYGGRDDYGFYGAHAVLAEKTRYHNGHTDFYTRDPDHGSPSRSWKPPYDIIKSTQLQRAMVNLPTYTAFSNTYVIYPTVKKTLPTTFVPVWGADIDADIKRAYTASAVAKRLTSLGVKFSSTRNGAINESDIAAGLNKLGINYGRGIQLTDVHALMKR